MMKYDQLFLHMVSLLDEQDDTLPADNVVGTFEDLVSEIQTVKHKMLCTASQHEHAELMVALVALYESALYAQNERKAA